MNKLIALLIGVGLIFPFATFAQAGSAEWDLDPVSGDWNTSANWTPMTVPNGPADTATFALSNTTSISISANTQVEGITFTPAATNSYTITAGPFLTPSALTVSGTGITNNSGTTHNFVTGVDGANAGGGIVFTNSATAGSLTLFTNNGGAVAEGFTVFFDTSTAGSGIFINNGGAVAGRAGAFMEFADTSTAASGTFTNNGGAVAGAGRGFTEFVDTSTAASGTFTNNGATAAGAEGGSTEFFDNSTAGSGTFTNNGGAVRFARGGLTEFFGTSNAGSGTFINNGGAVASAAGAATHFSDTATAGSGIFINNGGAVPGASSGVTIFAGTSTAANGTFTNNGGTADNTLGGGTVFRHSSTAGNGMFINNGGTVGGGFTEFLENSTASSGIFINNGGAAAGAGGITAFTGNSTADSATLIANGGAGAGQGGLIVFAGFSSGGTSQVEVFGNGNLDISGHGAPGVTIGSIEGDGNVFLGENNLTVGSNNMDRTFSGVIQDGGQNRGTGGSLTKIGTGTLDLTGANTYTGDTNINRGVLKVDGSITSNTVVNGGTLAGMGTVNGNMINNATVSPGDAPGTLTINGTYTQAQFATLMIQIAGGSAGQFSVLNVLGNADLNGTLDPVLLDGFIPMIGQTFTFLNYAGLTGEFSRIKNEVFNNGTERWSITYQSTDAILTATKNVPDQASTLLLLTLSLLGLVTYHQSLRRRET